MIVYKTIFPDGMIYIGQSTKKNPNYFGSGIVVTNYIQKYGKTNLRREILCECVSQEELDYWEEFFIKKYNSIDRSIGHNILPGSSNKFGSGSPMLLQEVRDKVSKTKKENYKLFGSRLKGVPKSEEAKRKMSLAWKTRTVSLETRKKMSDLKQGQKGFMTGRKHSEESKNKIREKSKLKRHSEEVKQKIREGNTGKIISKESREKISNALKGNKNAPIKAISQFDLEGNFITNFPSIKEAVINTKIPQSYISAVCTGRQTTTRGYSFKFQ
jgi:hypothetical protein